MVSGVLLIMGASIVVAVVGHRLFEQTGVPESIFMILLGLILGPWLGVLRPGDVEALVPYVFTISIIIILLESGLSINIIEAVETMKDSSVFTVLVLLVTTVLCGVFVHVVLGWELPPSFILGVICSGTSTLPIVYFTSRMNLGKEVHQLLIFESIINDVTIITGVTFFLQFMILRLDPVNMVLNIFSYILIAVIYGLLGATAWAYILIRFLEDLKLKYLTTLAVSVMIYALAESHGGSGVISVMVFSMVVGNLPEFFRSHGIIKRKVRRFFTQIEVIQDEVTFLVKSVFFFMMGLIFDPRSLNLSIALIALSLSSLIAVSRASSVLLVSALNRRYLKHIFEISMMLPRGLTAGLAALMPLERGVNLPLLKEIVIVMILLTNIAATIGFMAFTKKPEGVKPKR